MTLPSALGLLHGTGFLVVGLGLAVKVAFSYGGWRLLKARRARRAAARLVVPMPGRDA